MEKGGRTKRISEELDGLKSLGHNVKLVTFSDPPSWVREQYASSSDWIVLRKGKGPLSLTLLWNLFSLVRRTETTLMSVHCEGSAFYAGLVSRFTGARCLATLHRSNLSYYRSSWKNRIFYRFVHRFLAVSLQRQALVAEAFGLDAEQVAVIHWGINPHNLASLPSKTVARERLSVASNSVLLSVGHLGEIKGHQDSIAALGMLKATYPDVHLYVAGDGAEEDYERLRICAKNQGVAERLTLLGQTSEIYDWLRAADLFVLPSREEAFGLVFLEAGLCERATVATHVGGIPEIVVDNHTGILVPVGAPAELAAAIDRLLGDARLRDEFGKAARERVIASFALEKSVKALDQLIAETVHS